MGVQFDTLFRREALGEPPFFNVKLYPRQKTMISCVFLLDVTDMAILGRLENNRPESPLWEFRPRTKDDLIGCGLDDLKIALHQGIAEVPDVPGRVHQLSMQLRDVHPEQADRGAQEGQGHDQEPETEPPT